MKKTKLKSQPRWVVRSFMAMGIVLGGIFAFISHPIGGTNAQAPTETTLLPGQEFNVAIKTLVPGNEGMSEYYYYDSNIKHIVRSNTEPESRIETQKISTDSSENEVVAWYDEDSQTIYYYSQSDTIYLNENSMYMFYEMNSLESIDMSSRDTSRVTSMSEMFTYDNNLETIYVGEGFETEQAHDHRNMFSNTYKLIGGNGTKYNDSYRDKTYAKIDNQSQSGYFTSKEGDIRVNFIVDGVVWSSEVVEYGATVSRPSPDPVKEGTEFKRRVDKNGTEFDFETKEIDRYTEIYASFDEAILLPGEEFNVVIKRLVSSYDWIEYFDNDGSIKHIVRSNTEPESGVDIQRISADDSEREVVAWYDEQSQTIYYYSESDTIYLNENSSYMFYEMEGLETIDMSGWDTSKVTYMDNMFSNCSSLTELDLSNWDTSNVTSMSDMFYYCNNLETIYVGEGFETEQLDSDWGMFEVTMNLIGGNGTKWNQSNPTDKTYAKIDNQSQSGYFTDKDYIRVNFIVAGEVRSGELVEYGATVNRPTTDPVKEGTEFRRWTDKNGVTFDFETREIDRYTEIYASFDEAILKPGEEFNVAIKTLVPGNERMSYYKADNDIKHIVRSNAGPEDGVETKLISLPYSEREVVAWYDEQSQTIYYYSESDTIYLNEDSSYMFYNMNSLESIDMSGWDTSRVTNMYEMFEGCYNLTELDLSNWDTSRVTNMAGMFENSDKLEIIYVGLGFKTDHVLDNRGMFNNTNKLAGGNGTKWNNSYTDKTYAIVDNQGQSGYFTSKEGDIRVNFIVDGMVWSGELVEYGATVNRPTTDPVKEGTEFRRWTDKNGVTFDFETREIDRYTEIYARFDSNEAILKPGQEFNNTIIHLAGSSYINNVTRSPMLPQEGVETDVISVPYSDNAVLAWYDNHTIYYFVPRGVIVYMNEDSSYMFSQIKGLISVDLSDWDSSRVKYVSNMFLYNRFLRTIYANRSFSVGQIINSLHMFGDDTDCWDVCSWSSNLKGGNGTTWDASHTDAEYARIDTEDEPGYFTYKDIEEAVSISFYDGSELLYSGYMVSGYTISESNFGKFSTFPSKVGYIFDGWYEEDTEDKFDLKNTPVAEDLKLYARWVVFQREDITICDPEDSSACITMMDRNLGAISAGMGCSGETLHCQKALWEIKGYDSYDACYTEMSKPVWEALGYDSYESCSIDPPNYAMCRCDDQWSSCYEESPDDLCGDGNYEGFDSYEDCEAESDYRNECIQTHSGDHGYYYQWGRNVGFDSRSGYIPTTELKAVWDPSYNNYGYVGPNSFILGEYVSCYRDNEFGLECETNYEGDYRENRKHYDGLRGGAEDSAESNWGYDIENHTATNVEGRQGPCPEGYHVPSIGEWNVVLDYWIKKNKDPEKIVLADGLIAGYIKGYSRVCYDQETIVDCWTDCEDWGCREYCDDWVDEVEVPCDGEYDSFVDYPQNDENIGGEFQEYFNIPFAGYRDADADIKSVGFGAYLWSSSPYVGHSSARHFSFKKSQIYTNSTYDRVRALSLRCFKNVADVPEQQNTGSTTTGSTTEPTTGGGGSSAGGSHGGAGGGAGGMASNNEPTTQDPENAVDPDATVDGNNSAGEFVYDSLKANPNYSDEMNEAYQYAYHYGITTKESVKEADMGGGLTRIAMAKMLSNYAINVLGKNNFDESRDCGFIDVSPMMDIEYDNGITNACKLGIMGINMPNGKFRPNDPVTRAEFVTALSRLLYNTEDGEDIYYSTHMELLNKLGIITVTDPTMKELRGYVMIMLMRSK